MAESKTIKGQAWIEGKQLVQEQILITTDGKSSYNVVELIDDVWENLTNVNNNDTIKYKTNSKKDYFYWDITMTDTETENDITVKIECPKPKLDLFTEPYNENNVEGDYPKYWVKRLRIAQENANKQMTVQKKEIVFQGTTYMNQNEQTVTISDMVVNNSDLGDITNLLSLF